MATNITITAVWSADKTQVAVSKDDREKIILIFEQHVPVNNIDTSSTTAKEGGWAGK